MRKGMVVAAGSAALLALLPTHGAVAAPGGAQDSYVQAESEEDTPTGKAAARAKTPGGTLVGQQATLTAADRPAGITPPTPGRTLAGAEVKVEALGSPPTYFYSNSSLTLAGDPPHKTDVAGLAFGNMAGGRCVPSTTVYDLTSTDYGLFYDFYGYKEGLAQPWDCVAAFIQSAPGESDPPVVYDVLEAPLVSTYQKPALSVGKVSLLGQRQKRLKLVKGVATELDVVVRNSGPIIARNVAVTGKGKGLKVNAGKIEAIRPGETGTTTIKVKVKGRKKPGKLALTVTGDGAKSTRKLNVKRVKPPKRPRAGKYRDKSGAITFAVRKGRITGWRGRMQTRCGGYPDNLTYTTNTYDFPKTKIPRSGIVQARDRGSNYGTYLEMRIVGGKATRGRFIYQGPNRCTAVVGFTAKRSGK